MNNTYFWKIINATVSRIASDIVTNTNFPKRENSGDAKSLSMFWEITSKIDFLTEFLQTARMQAGDDKLTLKQVLHSNTFEEKMEQKLQLLKELANCQKQT